MPLITLKIGLTFVWDVLVSLKIGGFCRKQVSEKSENDAMISNLRSNILLGGGFMFFSIFTPTWGNDPNLTSIFFRWVETQPPTRL